VLRSLAVAAAVFAAIAANAAEPSAADRQALLELAGRMDREWTAANADASAALFAPDATARFGDDPLATGREAIRAQFSLFFKDRPAGLRHVTTIERIEQVSADHALWDAEVRVDRRQPGGKWTTLTRIRNVTVAVRRPEGWRVFAVRAVPLR
jgi:uncharacterized protein (TIGR02246 family)